MAETKHQEEEPTLHPKRKPDLSRQDNEDNPHKAQKLEPPPPPPPDTNNDSSLPLHKNHHLEPYPLDSSIPEQNDAKFESNLLAEVEDDDDDDDEEEEEEYEDEDEDEDDDDGDSENGDGEKAVVDRKGKGIMRDDKGKGKLIEEENDDDDDDEDDDDSDSDIGSDVSDGESDLSDDPLAEVDLDNILPSRTRRRTVPPGIHIANDHRNHNKNLDDGDSGA